MGKVELKLEIDADLLARARAAGAEPQAVLEAALRALSAETPRLLGLVESARRKAADEEGSRRRAREWAEASRECLEEQRRWVEEHGPFGEAWRTW